MNIDLETTIDSLLDDYDFSTDISLEELLETAQNHISKLEIDEQTKSTLLDLLDLSTQTITLDQTNIEDLFNKINNFIQNNSFLGQDLIDLISPIFNQPVVEEPSTEAIFSKLYVFGDSLSDPGNIFNATQAIQPFQASFGLDLPVTPPSPPYFEGRFSNGLTWTSNLTADLNLSLTPSTELSLLSSDLPIPYPVTIADNTLTVSPFFNGATTTQSVNFAFGGAQIGTAGAGEFGASIPGVSTQVDFFVDDHQQANRTADPDALYVIWGGGNDYQTIPDAQPQAVVDDLATAVEDLYNLGGRNFLIADLPDLGKTPRALSDDAPVSGEILTNITNQHNALLSEALADLNDSLADANLIPLETNQLFEDILANPDEFGLTNTTEPFLDPDTLTPAGDNADEYLFWDLIHPTAIVHEAVGDLAIATLLSAQDGFNDIEGTATAERLSGTAENDKIQGDRGNNELTGKDGDDILIGGLGDDLLSGGRGQDSLIGGAGGDRFVLRSGTEADTIFDFKIGQDLLLLDGLTFAELSVTAEADKTVISLGNNSQVIASLTGINPDNIGSEDFVVI